MIQQRGILMKSCFGMLAVLFLADFSWAAGIGFRNDTNSTLIVQGASTVGGVVRRGPALVVPPKKTVWDNNLPMGVNRDITIYDADQGNAVLHRQPIPFQGQNLFFLIQPVPVPPGQPKALKLMPVPPPPNP